MLLLVCILQQKMVLVLSAPRLAEDKGPPVQRFGRGLTILILIEGFVTAVYLLFFFATVLIAFDCRHLSALRPLEQWTP